MPLRLLAASVLVACVPQAGGSSTDPKPDVRPTPPSTDGGRLLLDGAPAPLDVGATDGSLADAALGDSVAPSDGPLPDAATPDVPVGPPPPECDDGRDNDGDGRFDLDDADCTSSADPRESGGIEGAQCANGADDDEDGAIDFPADRGCAAAGDESEVDTVFVPECADEEDNDGDGWADYPDDPGCQGRGDGTEADPPVAAACANGVDDDGDGASDFPDDDGCEAAGDFSEIGPCGAGVEVIDIAGGGVHDGDLADAPARFVGSCGGAAGGEQVFRYRLERRIERLVVSTAHGETL